MTLAELQVKEETKKTLTTMLQNEKQDYINRFYHAIHMSRMSTLPADQERWFMAALAIRKEIREMTSLISRS